jgi:glutathione S-transferase
LQPALQVSAGPHYDLEKVDLAAKTTEGGADYTSINPKGYVPALALDDGQVLTEVSAVVQYLADQAPGSGLAPQPGTTERYKLLEWIGFVATELHTTWSSGSVTSTASSPIAIT